MSSFWRRDPTKQDVLCLPPSSSIPVWKLISPSAILITSYRSAGWPNLLSLQAKSTTWLAVCLPLEASSSWLRPQHGSEGFIFRLQPNPKNPFYFKTAPVSFLDIPHYWIAKPDSQACECLRRITYHISKFETCLQVFIRCHIIGFLLFTVFAYIHYWQRWISQTPGKYFVRTCFVSAWRQSQHTTRCS